MVPLPGTFLYNIGEKRVFSTDGNQRKQHGKTCTPFREGSTFREGLVRQGLKRGISGFGFRVSGLGIRDSGFRFRVSGFGFRVSGFGFRISGFGVKISGLR